MSFASPGAGAVDPSSSRFSADELCAKAEELVATTEWLAEDLQLELDDDSVRIPVDQQCARVLYLVNPREIKFFPLSLMAAAGPVPWGMIAVAGPVGRRLPAPGGAAK